MPIPTYGETAGTEQPGFAMPKIAYMIMPAFLFATASLSAQPLSPHEKVSEIYKIVGLCPDLKVDRKALDRFAMLNGIDLTPGSRDERWFLKRAAYDLRRLPHRHKGYLCKQGMTRYGPQGGIARGIMLTN